MKMLLASTSPSAILAYDSPALDTLVEAAVEMGVIAGSKITTRSKDSASMLPYWDKVDAIMDGVEGMRSGTKTYLPQFTDEPDTEYQNRLRLTKMTNVYRDIVEGLSSKPFEQAVQLISDQTNATADTDDDGIPPDIKTFSNDVDGSGNNLTVFAANTFFNGVNNAIDWIMVDHSKRDPSVRSVADMRAKGVRPYWSHIIARNVLEVRSKIISGIEVLTYARILEPGEKDHIRIFERSNDGIVTWALYEKTEERGDDNEFKWRKVDGGVISINIIPLVPFVTGRREGRCWKFDPPMRGAADLQVELYQQESGLKFLKTVSAYPMLAANGMTPPVDAKGKAQTDIKVGPLKVLWGKQNDDGTIGNWQWVEPSSENLKFLGEDIKATIEQLREIGRQPLTASSSNITVITAAVAANKARSAVKAWAFKLKDALENALRITAMWMAIDYKPTVHVFAEFDDWMEGEDLSALDAARERGDLSHETWSEEMQRRGVLSTNFTIERERTRLLTEAPGDDAEETTEQRE